MSKLMILGVILFFLGGLALMGLVLAHGGAAKSRQFAVWAQLWSGRAGPVPRRLLRGAVLMAGGGALLCFVAVSQLDRERTARCHDHCLAAGYSEGRIGPSVERSRAGRFVACVCSAPGRPPLELRADDLPP